MNPETITAQIPSIQINMPCFLYVYGWQIYEIPEFFDTSMIAVAKNTVAEHSYQNVVMEIRTREFIM